MMRDAMVVLTTILEILSLILLAFWILVGIVLIVLLRKGRKRIRVIEQAVTEALKTPDGVVHVPYALTQDEVDQIREHIRQVRDHESVQRALGETWVRPGKGRLAVPYENNSREY